MKDGNGIDLNLEWTGNSILDNNEKIRPSALPDREITDITGLQGELDNKIESNIYSADGTLTDNRNIACDGNELAFNNASLFNLSSSSGVTVECDTKNIINTQPGEAGIDAVEFADNSIGTTINGSSYNLNFNAIPGFSNNNDLLTIDSATGDLQRITQSSLPKLNVYTVDGFIPATTVRTIGATNSLSSLQIDPILDINGNLLKNGTAIKGSILAGNDTSTSFDAVSVGVNNSVLTADSSSPSGVVWRNNAYGEIFGDSDTTSMPTNTILTIPNISSQLSLFSNFDSPSDGVLRYTGTDTRIFIAQCHLSTKVIGGSPLADIWISKNGTVLNCTRQRIKIEDNVNDPSPASMSCLVELSTNDELGLSIRLYTTGSVGLHSFTLYCHTIN
jgi:hypothetical protein